MNTIYFGEVRTGVYAQSWDGRLRLYGWADRVPRGVLLPYLGQYRWLGSVQGVPVPVNYYGDQVDVWDEEAEALASSLGFEFEWEMGISSKRSENRQ